MARRDPYPGYRVMDQRGHWDAVTRKVVMDRVHNVPSFSHFDAHQQASLEALCESVIPQAGKPEERRVPIAPWIDMSVGKNTLEGFRFDDMPPNPTAWEWGLEGLDQTAGAVHGRDFADLEPPQRREVLDAVRAGNPPGEAWRRMPATRWFIQIAVRQISGVYYAHPYAWDEIGFGGPAYPRGYFALNHGAPEPWEVEERRGGRDETTY